LWIGRNPDPRTIPVTYEAAIAAVEEIQPRDPIEGMLAAQMVVTHGAAMECFRRAHLPEQSFEGRHMALTHASKLLRSYAALVRRSISTAARVSRWSGSSTCTSTRADRRLWVR
jgi:hypothetical protein